MAVSERIRRISKVIMEILLNSAPCFSISEISEVTVAINSFGEVTTSLSVNSPITRKWICISIIELEPI